MCSHVPQLTDAIRLLSGAKVGIVGDLVADLYVSGRSDRVSREAPVLIVCHEDEWLRPGGAANVAANVAALGGIAHLVGLVGDDDPGRRLLASLSESGAVRCGMVVVTRGRDTITKTRFLAGAKLTSRQQVLRLDRQPADPPDDRLLADLRARVERVDAEVDAWVASDYGYGSFDEPLRVLLRKIAERKPVVADSRWELAKFTGMSVIKPNEEEAEVVARQLGLQAGEVAMLAAALAARLEARSALVTLGNQGMVLVTEGRTVRIPASGSDEIVDLTGAGDSVAATLTAALAGGADIETAARLANHAGGVVVMKEGAATVSPAELAAAVNRSSAAG
ncbi:MAG: bifunctional hydroxymethylpyrimidine kinase/phosphomethylpyrimidine kinase [Phycisphaerae bacterium]|nr:bifunctional hydroxymethylpyrimidine kinase/phosphomethylpyrimidine kinase [Phycisphaerae bacterium]